MELTDRRAKPAVYFGGKSRIIDFALSNALNSGIRRIAVATQYKAHSLIRHLQRGWNFFRPERNESFDILPASQRVSETMLVSRHRRRGLSEHRHHRELRPAVHRRARRRPHLQDGLRADAAAARRHRRRRHRRLLEVPLRGGQRLRRHACRRERPHHRVPREAEGSAADARQARTSRSPAWASTSSRRTFLIDQLQARRRRPEFEPRLRQGHHSLPGQERQSGRAPLLAAPACARARRRKPYWRDVGTVDAYWEANIDLTDVVPELDLYDRDWPIWTYGEITPPAKFVHDDDGRRGVAISSLVSGGCIVSGASLSRVAAVHRRARALLSRRSHEAVVLPYVDIGRDVRLTKRRHRPRRAHSRRPGRRRGPRARRQALPPHRERRLA